MALTKADKEIVLEALKAAPEIVILPEFLKDTWEYKILEQAGSKSFGFGDDFTRGLREQALEVRRKLTRKGLVDRDNRGRYSVNAFGSQVINGFYYATQLDPITFTFGDEWNSKSKSIGRYSLVPHSLAILPYAKACGVSRKALLTWPNVNRRFEINPLLGELDSANAA